GAVAMRFLISARRHLRDMRMHAAVGENELDVGAAGAARLVGLQLEAFEIGDEIRLPHMAALPHQKEIALARIVFILADAVGERRLGVEDEVLVVEYVHDQRHADRRDHQRALLSAAVEMAVARIERNGEEAARAPFEAALAATRKFELGAAAAFED